MKDHLKARQRRRELLITLSFSVFSVLMIIVTPIMQWPVFYIPLLMAELAYVWWSYITGFQTYVFRAFIITIFINLNVFLYGVHGEDFFVLIPTLCVEFLLLSLYEIPRILDVAVWKAIFLLGYHLFIKGYTLPEGHLERNRIMLQSVSLVVLMLLCAYRVRHHLQEENDVVDLEENVLRTRQIKDDFVANTSHELRTPVNTISGMCEILLQKALPDEIHRNVLDIQMTSVELQNIVTDILDYAALESNTLELQPRAYNITSTMNDIMNMTVFANREKKLEVIFDCDPNIPCLLEGDEQQLRRVLNNLIGNAIKFTNEGGVVVRFSYRPEEYGINLIVSVRDTGVGMNLEEQDLIQQDFYQSDSARNSRRTGVGLGVPISAALIRRMGGFLTIKSRQGRGSEFSFAIPQKVIDADPCISLQNPGLIRLVWFYNPESNVSTMRDAFVDQIKHFSERFNLFSQRATSLEECKRRLSQGSGTPHLVLGSREYAEDKDFFDDLAEDITIILITDRDAVTDVSPRIHLLYKPYNAIMLAELINGREHVSPLRKKEQKKFIAPTAKILVVDDNLMNLKVVEGLLRKYRIKIVAATSGEEALSLIDSQDFDFVFMDHMMPGMDGVECFHHIREKSGFYFAQVPIIALTANAIAGSREMFLAEGFNDFVAKPIDTALLNEVLQKYIPNDKQLFEEDLVDVTQEEIVRAADEEAAAREKANRAEADARTEAPVAEFPPRAQAEEPRKAPAPPAPAKEEAAPVEAPEPPKEAPAQAATRQDFQNPDNPFEELPGIDRETALTYCGSVEDFRELAGVYCESGKGYAEGLEAAFREKDLKNYALLAHTIKSTSRTLGALDLSDLALAQEMAAKEENLEAVRQKHEPFSLEYHRVLTMLSGYAGVGIDESALPKVSEGDRGAGAGTSEWGALKEDLLRSLEAYEMKAYEDCLEKAEGISLGGVPLKDALAEVTLKASEFDFDGAVAALREIGGQA